MAISYMQDGNDYTGGLTLNKMYQQPTQNPATVTGLPASTGTVASTATPSTYNPGFGVGKSFENYGSPTFRTGYGIEGGLDPDYVKRMAAARPDLFGGIDISKLDTMFTPNMVEGESQQIQQGWNMDPTLAGLFGNWNMQRRGADSMQDGRTNAMYDAQGNLLYADTPYSYTPAKDTMNTLLEGGALAAAAFGGLGLAGAGPWSGLSNMMGGGADLMVGMDGGFGAATGAAEAAGAAEVGGTLAGATEAAGAGGSLLGGALPEIAIPAGNALGAGIGGEALALGGAGIGAPALNMAAIESGLGATGYGFNEAAAASGLFNPSTIGSAAGSAGGMNGFLNAIGMSMPNTASAIGKIGQTTLGNIVGNAASGGGSSGSQGGMNPGNILGSLFQMYQGNQYQDSIKELYGQLSSQFGPDSAYAKQMRQQLDRRDAAAGRRSQYGPREVELQAKLAENQSRQATTLAGLLKDSNAGLTSQLQAGIGLGNETGLNNWLGSAASGVGSGIWADVKNSDWWKDLFGGD
jgi:hypothetical protein